MNAMAKLFTVAVVIQLNCHSTLGVGFIEIPFYGLVPNHHELPPQLLQPQVLQPATPTTVAPTTSKAPPTTTGRPPTTTTPENWRVLKVYAATLKSLVISMILWVLPVTARREADEFSATQIWPRPTPLLRPKDVGKLLDEIHGVTKETDDPLSNKRNCRADNGLVAYMGTPIRMLKYDKNAAQWDHPKCLNRLICKLSAHPTHELTPSQRLFVSFFRSMSQWIPTSPGDPRQQFMDAASQGANQTMLDACTDVGRQCPYDVNKLAEVL